MPDVLWRLWDRSSQHYAGLEMLDVSVLMLLLDGAWGNRNGLLSLPIRKAAAYGVDARVRRESLRRLERAGVILKTAKRQGTKPEMYAVFFWPLAQGYEAAAIRGAFIEWANSQRMRFWDCFGVDVPDNFREIDAVENEKIL